ncbi:hypothetical protein V6N13_076804 [Hibiscus sabdariffa]
MSNVEDGMTHLSIGGGEDDGVQIELEESDSLPSFGYCFVGGLGGISATVSGPKLDHKYLGLGEGFDVVMGSPEEESPMGSVETTKRPRFLTKDLKVSLVKDFTGDNSPTSAGLDHGVSQSQ